MLIKDPATLRKYVNSTTSLDYDSIESSISDAEAAFIIPAIGRELYDELNNAYSVINPTLSEEQEKLLPYIQKPLAALATMLWLPEGMVKLTADGVLVVSNDSMKTAWKYLTDKLEFKYLNTGLNGIDLLLQFLERNKDDYETWTDSSAYTISKENFVNNADTFSKYFDIRNSRRIFMRLKPMMVKVEDFFIRSNLGDAYFTALKTAIIADDVSADDKIVLEYIQKATVNFTMSRALEDGLVEMDATGVFINMFNDTTNTKTQVTDHRLVANAKRALGDGHIYLRQMKSYLNKTASDVRYTDYKTSGPWVDPASPQGFQNSKNNSFWMAR